jgi:hypothetical protein
MSVVRTVEGPLAIADETRRMHSRSTSGVRAVEKDIAPPDEDPPDGELLAALS